MLPTGLQPRKARSGEKENPDSSIQDGKKRFGGLGNVFIGMRPVTGDSVDYRISDCKQSDCDNVTEGAGVIACNYTANRETERAG